MKPSDILGDTTSDLHRKAAQEANRKRAERRAKQKMSDLEAKWMAENKAAEEAAHKKAQEDARREAERKLAEEEARIRVEEEAMWASMSGSTKKEQAVGKPQKQGKIRTSVDGKEFDSLARAMAFIDPKLWGKENDYRTSHWIRINRSLKRDGQVMYMGHLYVKI
jgi:membrane protein involved in colicin uptake